MPEISSERPRRIGIVRGNWTSSKHSRKKRSKSPTSDAAKGNSSLMRDYRKKKLEKNPDENTLRKKRKRKKRVKKFSVSAEEI